MQQIVWIVGTGADGSPAAEKYTVDVTQTEYDLGEHYRKAQDLTELEQPLIAIDEAEIERVRLGLAS